MSISESFDGLHASITDRIIRIFYTVARELGSGFLEVVYRRSMGHALREAGFQAGEEVPVPVYFRGLEVGIFYADIVVDDIIILELKAADTITQQHKAQLTHYLRATKMEIGYVLAFGNTSSFQRAILTNDRKANPLRR